MDFPAFDYMAWAKAQQGRYAFDLSVSGMSPPDAAQLPTSGIIALLQLPPAADDLALAQNLAQTQEVLIAPGSYFGAPGTLRIAYGLEPARFSEALERFEAGGSLFHGMA